MQCSICNKPDSEIKILNELHLNITSHYVKPDGGLENMNNLWRETSEFFCEDCFKKYAEWIGEFYRTNKKVTVK